jgi:adenylate cyclase
LGSGFGISEEILNLLAKKPELKVISRTSSFSFKGRETTSPEIGKALQVNY